MELSGKEQKSRRRGTLKVKTSPLWRIRMERLKIRLPLTGWKKEGNTEIQSSPCGGEDTTPKGVKFPPPLRVVTGVGEGRA